MKQTLWIISELFPPEETSTGYIMGEIANAMTLKYDVKVICGPTVYDSNKRCDQNSKQSISESIEVLHVDIAAEDRNSKLSRIKKFLLLSWRMYREAKKNIKNGDRVLMVTNPFPLVVLMGYLRRHRDFSLAMLVHDVAPENLYTDIEIPEILYQIAQHVFNKAYASTDMLIPIGRDMREVLVHKIGSVESVKEKWPRIEVIENWGDVENIWPEDEPFEAEKITIQYAGNIGNAQGVGEFVDVLHEAKCSHVSFCIWGTGRAELSIMDKVHAYGMVDQVSFRGTFLRSEQQHVLNNCDLAMVCLVNGMYGLGVPSKTYNIFAAGKPILYIGERGTEIWRVIEENGNGICFEPQDKRGLIEYLNSLSLADRYKLKKMGSISRKLAEGKYSKAIILERFLDVI